jgi:hypothetical protein
MTDQYTSLLNRIEYLITKLQLTKERCELFGSKPREKNFLGTGIARKISNILCTGKSTSILHGYS